MLLFVGALFLGALTWSEQAWGEGLYKVYGSRGSITFTSVKPRGKTRYETVRLPNPKYSSILSHSGYLPRPVKSEYDFMISEVADEHSLEPALVKAVVHAESSFNPFATSHKGAMGLMQLMPQTAKRFGVKNAYHPLDNLSAGARYLKWLLERYNGNLRLALAAYNAGEGVVDRLREVPPYAETQGYVRKVLSFVELYRCTQIGKVETVKDGCRT